MRLQIRQSTALTFSKAKTVNKVVPLTYDQVKNLAMGFKVLLSAVGDRSQPHLPAYHATSAGSD